MMPVLFNPPTSLTTTPAAGRAARLLPDQRPGRDRRLRRQLAARYGNTGSFWAQHPNIERHPITTWQIWNEPNLPVYWRPHLSPKGYAQMLCGAYQQIKAVDPNAEISTAGLPKSRIRSSIWPLKYVPRMMKAGRAAAASTRWR